MDSYDFDVPVSAMSKQELALMYAPELSPHGAVNRLMAWIEHNPELQDALRLTGYRKHVRMLTPQQVGLIFEHLGEP